MQEEREAGARLLLGLVVGSLLLGVGVLAYKHKAGTPYTIEENCVSNLNRGFYPFIPGCEEFEAVARERAALAADTTQEAP